MFKLITPINPFGAGCSPLTEVDAETKAWLIETEKCQEEDFEESSKNETVKKQKQK